MPIPPPPGALPFDTADMVLDLARARLNDTILSSAGNLLADSQPYTLTLLNGAFRHLQEDMADAGTPALKDEALLLALPVVANIDPAIQVFVNCQYFFDGTSYYTSPVLPFNCIRPLWMRERQSGTTNIFTPMGIANDYIPERVKTNYLGVWQWRNNAIYMPGALIPRDVRIGIATYLADIAPIGVNPFGKSPVPLIRCADALAHYVCAEFAFARGQAEAVGVGNSFLAQGQAAMKRMKNRDARADQRGNHRRIGYSSGRHCGWSNW